MIEIFFFNDTSTTEIYTLSLHDALPILNLRFHLWKIISYKRSYLFGFFLIQSFFKWYFFGCFEITLYWLTRSEEHTSELQSRHISYAVFCLKKKTKPFISLLHSLEQRSY